MLESKDQDIDQRLEEKLEMFRLFGTLGSRKQRKNLCAYLERVAKGKNITHRQTSNSSDFSWLYDIVHEVLDTPGLQDQLKKHDALRKEVVLDLIKFLEEQIKIKKSASFSSSSSKSQNSNQKKNKVSRMLSSLSKKLTFGKQKNSNKGGKRERMKRLNKKVEKYLKLEKMLDPFTNSYSKLVGKTKGVWRDTGFKVLEHYDELLENEGELQELADLLGRYRKAEQELMDKDLEGVVKEKIQISYSRKEEVVGVHESNELSYVLPIELSLLSEEKTSTIFFQKYAEKKLQTFQLTGKDKLKTEDEKKKKSGEGDENRKGPIIICVDTSASMWGVAEKTAKVLCFGLLKVALRENRKCFLISFSKEIQTLELTQFQHSLQELIEFLKMSFAGGTDTSKAIRKSLDLLAEKPYKSADVLLLTDGDMPQLDPKLSLEIRDRRDKGHFFFQVIFGHETNAKLLPAFDEHIFYHPGKKENLKKIVKDLKNWGKRRKK
ncbi:VWA domain-containing protein [Sediminitomix flava]|uniref:Uncharacterized protein with von Willebrand factor type A (VWA) domain n=1 Tax=Sediminitomix flava TaxID=379075 RepID=A0A315ZGX0_SEDFL|nr:VWA domain-containing protein [Sediminitomix flava]PWJ44098.1 uncharacterized protein with von Willebrand factor type A (vWA) domain [Sediminitomix flava]